MEAVLKGAFPDASFTTAADVRSFGERMGYPMPDLGDDSRNLDPLIKQDQNTVANVDRLATQPKVISSQGRNLSSDEVSNQAPRLVSDPYGRKHYIGPTGSLSFLAEVQEFVASYDGPGKSSVEYSTSSSSPFALDNVAKALETEGDEDENGEKNVGAEQVAENVPSPLSVTSGNSHITNLPDLDKLLQSLPPPSVMHATITAYFNNVHADFPLFHRATFQEGYEAFVLKPLRERSRSQSRGSLSQPIKTLLPRADWGWFVCLNMILCFGSLADREITADSPNLHHKMSYLSFSLLPHLTTKCALSNVQALLLLSLYAHNNNERNTAWVLVGTATRMSFALGLHQNDLDALYRPIERETRKRVWCTLYAFEQFLCSTLGRPSGIGDTDVEVRVPTEGLLDDANGVGADFARHDLRLNHLLATARRLSVQKRRKSGSEGIMDSDSSTSAGSCVLDEKPPIRTVDELLKELYSWKENLPLHLQMPALAVNSEQPVSRSAVEQLKLSLSRQNPRQIRALILLHIQYHYIIILMTRSSLLHEISNKNNQQAPSSLSPDDSGLQSISSPTSGSGRNYTSHRLALAAVDSASQSAILIIALHEFSVLNGISGLDVFYAYHAAIVLLLRILGSENPNTTASGTNSEKFAKARVQELIVGLRKAIGGVKQSKTMTTFANVVDKFAGVVETIRNGDARNGIGNDSYAHDRPQVHLTKPQSMAPVAISSSGEPSTTALHSSDMTLHPSSSSSLSSFPTSLNGPTFPPTGSQPIHSSIAFSSSSTNGANSTTSIIPPTSYNQPSNPSIWPSTTNPPQHSSNIMPANFVTFNGDVGDPYHMPQYYHDPLSALANGYIVNWDDLDAFVAGMKE